MTKRKKARPEERPRGAAPEKKKKKKAPPCVSPHPHPSPPQTPPPLLSRSPFSPPPTHARTHTHARTFKGYEEIWVPPAKAQPPPGPGELVAVSSLPPWAQLAFVGVASLNRVQSRIFPTAFRSNENMLVCAPTGAGKTNIAMIAVLREVGANIVAGCSSGGHGGGGHGGGGGGGSGGGSSGGYLAYDGPSARPSAVPHIDKSAFKIVYVAPMKALAAEVTANFSRRLQPLGLKVRELTGDMQLTKRELQETQMIVTTPEKWDVITRKGGDVAVASLVRLLILDEVHLLADERGPVIETLVARTLRQVEASQSMIRIVGLSATLPNYRDVGEFLR